MAREPRRTDRVAVGSVRFVREAAGKLGRGWRIEVSPVGDGADGNTWRPGELSPRYIRFAGMKIASKPSERPRKSRKLCANNEMLWSDPFTRYLHPLEITSFSVSTSDSGPFTLRAGYSVSGVIAYDSRAIDVISGEISVVPSVAFVSPSATFPYQALDSGGDFTVRCG